MFWRSAARLFLRVKSGIDCMRRGDLITLLFVWVLVPAPLGSSLAAQPLPRSVLIINQSGPGRPWYVALDNSFRAAVISSPSGPISVYEEDLDLNVYNGVDYEESLRVFFQQKYRDKSIGVVVAVGSSAVEYALQFRAAIWPNVPVVFAGVDHTSAAQFKLPPNVTGTVMQMTLRDMVAEARLLIPDLKQIALVGDPLERQTFYRPFKDELPKLAAKLQIIDLTGLSMTELRKRAATLPESSAIVYTGIYLDGAGVTYIPADALELVAKVANRPIVVDVDSDVGRGAVGGPVLSAAAVGEEAAKLALRILNGESASAIPVTTGNFAHPIFDWRQLQRWGISEARLPPGSEIRFRDPTAWEQYRIQIMLIVAALIIQTALIIGLLHEHRYRRSAESVSRRAMDKLADLNRVATAGELTAAIAHEVSQPLAAMLTNANAGLRWLNNKTPDLDEVRAAMNRVVSGGHRASEVIVSIRAMFRKDGHDETAVDLNGIIQDVLGLVHPELQAQGIIVQTGLTKPLPLVLGHSGQLQQVILNLVRNGADAMGSISGRARILRLKTAIHDLDSVQVSVEDSGTGIDPKDIDRIFESFFTTKSQGMGMGLSICRSIIEAHRGRLWASPGVTEGSVFNIQLPAIRP
jgi:signal transduction histidine kinase